MTYYRLFPQQLTYAEACEELHKAKVPQMPHPDRYFYAEGLTKQQIERLKENFTIDERDEAKEREDARIRALGPQYREFRETEECQAKFSEICQRYKGDISSAHRAMLEYIKSVRPDLVEAYPYTQYIK